MLRSRKRWRGISAAAARIRASSAPSSGPPGRRFERSTAMKTFELSRRELLKAGGALIVSFNLFPALDLLGAEAQGPVTPDPTQLDSWIAVAEDGTVTVFTSKVELGTGVKTALAQIDAEELDVPLGK